MTLQPLVHLHQKDPRHLERRLGSLSISDGLRPLMPEILPDPSPLPARFTTDGHLADIATALFLIRKALEELSSDLDAWYCFECKPYCDKHSSG